MANPNFWEDWENNEKAKPVEELESMYGSFNDVIMNDDGSAMDPEKFKRFNRDAKVNIFKSFWQWARRSHPDYIGRKLIRTQKYRSNAEKLEQKIQRYLKRPNATMADDKVLNLRKRQEKLLNKYDNKTHKFLNKAMARREKLDAHESGNEKRNKARRLLGGAAEFAGINFFSNRHEKHVNAYDQIIKAAMLTSTAGEQLRRKWGVQQKEIKGGIFSPDYEKKYQDVLAKQNDKMKENQKELFEYGKKAAEQYAKKPILTPDQVLKKNTQDKHAQNFMEMLVKEKDKYNSSQAPKLKEFHKWAAMYCNNTGFQPEFLVEAIAAGTIKAEQIKDSRVNAVVTEMFAERFKGKGGKKEFEDLLEAGGARCALTNEKEIEKQQKEVWALEDNLGQAIKQKKEQSQQKVVDYSAKARAAAKAAAKK